MQPQLKMGYLVSGNFFSVLRVAPHLGRPFRADEDEASGRDAVAVLSYDLWKSEFGGDPGLLGRRGRLNFLDSLVMALRPESFSGIDHLFRPAFYIPIAMGSQLSPPNRDLLTNQNRRNFFVK